MSKIGDLWFALRGEDKTLQVDVKKAGDKAGTSFGAQMAGSFKKSWSGANIGKGFVQGLGLAGGLGAVRLMSGAISGLVDVMGDAVAGALADQESQNRLAASLAANVPAWSGNTRAIEDNIKAKQRLGFDDEQLRDALTVLVGATHDVTEAQNIMNTAMDLARFKGIDLRTASEALIKVEGGQYRSLKQLGIKLKDNATSEEALAAVQAVTAGQAEAYADTLAGKMLSAQIEINERIEELGYKLLPIVVNGLDALNFILGDTGDSLDDLRQKATEPGGFFDVFASNEAAFRLERVTKVAGELGMSVDDLYRIVQSQGVDIGTAKIEDYTAAIRTAADESSTAAEKIKTHAFDVIEKEAREMGISVEQGAKNGTYWMGKFRDAVVSDVEDMIDKAFDPLETRASLHDTRLELLADKETARTAKTKEERRQARDDIISDLRDEADALSKLGDAGELTAKDVERFARDARSQYGSMSKDAIAKTEAIITKLQELQRLKLTPKTLIIDAKLAPGDKAALQRLTKHAAGHGPTMVDSLATGGYLGAGQAAWVGERGRELFVPTTPGTVVPHVQSEALATTSASGGGITVNLLDRMEVRNVRDIADGLRMVERRGYLGRR
jgi:hypothetical protein